MASWNHPENNGMSFNQTVDLQYQSWNTTWDWGNGRTWVQAVDLYSGAWAQEHWAGNVLVWRDTWNMTGTMFNPNSTASHDEFATTLLAHGEAAAAVEESEATDYTTAAIVSASVLTLSVLACAVV